MVEYVIWGIPKGEEHEDILIEKFNGQPLTNKGEALKLVKILEKKLECKKVRIQEINLTNGFINDFKGTINF